MVALQIAFLSLLVAVIARDFDVAKFKAALSSVGVLPIVACFAIDVGFVTVESVRILVLSRHAYAFWLIFRSRYLSALISMVLPGLAAGDLVRVFLMDRAKPGNKAGILALLLGNRLYGLLCLVSLGVVALAQPAGASLLAKAQGWGTAIIVAGLVALTSPLWTHWSVVRRACEWLLARMPELVAGPATRAFHALLGMTSLRQWLFAIATSTITNLLVVTEFWIVSTAAGLTISFAEWCLFVPFIAVATVLPLGIGAVGTQEAALLAVSRLAGIPFEPLLLVSAAMHVVRIGGTLPGFAFYGDLVQTIHHLRAQRQAPMPAEGAE
jgi:hypothetical protein